MTLFSPLHLPHLTLRNRVVMAPMTRSRAIGNLPNTLMADYYTQRASAGLIVTEGVAPSPNGLGYARIPGLFSDAQVEAFRSVTAGVHKRGGKIVVQLMHTGRVGHPHNMTPGARLLAPSAVAAAGTMYTDAAGPMPHPTPQAMNEADIQATQAEFVTAARNAIAAGFDGVELHGANGYLLEQFLNPTTNRRTDHYGGGAKQRTRFVIETARAVAEAIGQERVGLRISPFNTFNDMGTFDSVEETYRDLASELRGLMYLHVVRNPSPGFSAALEAVSKAFGGVIMLNGGFDRATAEEALSSGRADLVSFGRPFIANPDLVERMQGSTALAQPDPATFYTPGADGYTDYPTA